jgi:glycerate kinase
MLSALGFEFLDSEGCAIAPGAKGLEKLTLIKADKVAKGILECRFSVACDVTNPLCGKEGCSAVYGPQKGADQAMIKDMDKWLSDYAILSKTINPSADETFPGSGAAGGMGFAFMTYLGAELKSGIELILKETNIEEYIKDAHLVITGEGRLDAQTAMGKAPCGIASIAKKHQKPVIAFAGGVTPDAKAVHRAGIDAYFPVVRGVCTLAEAMETQNAKANITDAVEEAMRVLKIGY